MASLSSKKIASANTNTLKELHLISSVVNALVLLVLFIFQRPASKWKYIVFSIPAFACQFTLEKSGRPIYSVDQVTGLQKLVRSGDDIKGPGLYEYMFDCIYITWLCDVLMVVFGSNKVWLIYLVIPIYVTYKVSSIAKSFFGNKTSASQQVAAETDSVPQGKSKRQTKLEKRGQQSQRVRTR